MSAQRMQQARAQPQMQTKPKEWLALVAAAVAMSVAWISYSTAGERSDTLAKAVLLSVFLLGTVAALVRHKTVGAGWACIFVILILSSVSVTWSSGTTQDQDVLPPGVPDGKWREWARNVRYENGVLSAQVLIHGKDVGDGVWMEDPKPDFVHGTWVAARIAIDFPLPEGQYLDVTMEGVFKISKLKKFPTQDGSSRPVSMTVLEVKKCSQQAPVQNNITVHGTQYQNVSTPDDLIKCGMYGTSVYADSSCTSPLPALPRIGQQFYTKNKNNACSSNQRGENNTSYSYAPTTIRCASSPSSSSAQPMSFLIDVWGEDDKVEVHNVSTIDDLESCSTLKYFQDPNCKSPQPALPKVGDTMYMHTTPETTADQSEATRCLGKLMSMKRIAAPTNDSPAAAPAS